MEQYHPIQFHEKIKKLVSNLMNTMAEENAKNRYVLKRSKEFPTISGVPDHSFFVQQETSWLDDIQYRLKRLFS